MYVWNDRYHWMSQYFLWYSMIIVKNRTTVFNGGINDDTALNGRRRRTTRSTVPYR
ncbi:hypothetical protein O9993_00390 [Vibrio lentus]|nr:hypothetical protein [Vibrio lentus]